MVCDDCKNNEASVHLSEIVNNKKKEMNLCEKCADKRGFEIESVVPDFGVGNLVSQIAKSNDTDVASVLCPRCRMKYSEFKKSGRLGCGHCYIAFEPLLHELIRKIHGSDNHAGKVPQNSELSVSKSREIDRLRKILKEAVQNEDFEKAAEIRDTLKSLSIVPQ